LIKKKNYLDHLQFCLLRRPGFDSSQDRFKEKKEEQILQPPAGKIIP
jgi:hypothetical protein